MGLGGSGSAEGDPVTTCQIARHGPDRRPNSRVVYRRLPCEPRSREREKRSAAGTENAVRMQKQCIWYMKT